jgi:hypothetical protein
MEKLNPILGDATTGTADLRDKQAELRAKFDNLQTKVGEALQGPLADLLTWLTDMVDAIGPAIDGWKNLGAAIQGFSQDIATPLAKIDDALIDILKNIPAVVTAMSGVGNVGTGGQINVGTFDPRARPGAGEGTTTKNLTRVQERNGVRSGGIGSSMGGP